MQLEIRPQFDCLARLDFELLTYFAEVSDLTCVCRFDLVVACSGNNLGVSFCTLICTCVSYVLDLKQVHWVTNKLDLIKRWAIRDLSFNDCLYFLCPPCCILLLVGHKKHSSSELPSVETWLNVSFRELALEICEVVLGKSHVERSCILEFRLEMSTLHAAQERRAVHRLEVFFTPSTVLASRRFISFDWGNSFWLDHRRYKL